YWRAVRTTCSIPRLSQLRGRNSGAARITSRMACGHCCSSRHGGWNGTCELGADTRFRQAAHGADGPAGIATAVPRADAAAVRADELQGVPRALVPVAGPSDRRDPVLDECAAGDDARRSGAGAVGTIHARRRTAPGARA